jgi:UDP-glucose 4-epimerase
MPWRSLIYIAISTGFLKVGKHMILVTGGAGFIGPKLAEQLLIRGEMVRILDNLSTGSLSNISGLMTTGGVELVKGDVRDKDAVLEAAKGCGIIYHLAAQSSVPLASEDPLEDMEINVGGTLSVLEAAKSLGSKVVFASSSVVYGRSARTPTAEHEPLVPYSFYGASKAAAETYCRVYSELFGVPTVVLRLFNIYGPWTNKGLMVDLYRKLLRSPKKLELLGSGEQTKDYLYLDDTVEAFILAPERAKCTGEAYNIGLGESYSVREVAGMMLRLLGLGDGGGEGSEKVEVKARGGVAWPGDVELTQPDVGRAERELGWKAKTPMEEGLTETLRGFQRRLGQIEGARALG